MSCTKGNKSGENMEVKIMDNIIIKELASNIKFNNVEKGIMVVIIRLTFFKEYEII